MRTKSIVKLQMLHILSTSTMLTVLWATCTCICWTRIATTSCPRDNLQVMLAFMDLVCLCLALHVLCLAVIVCHWLAVYVIGGVCLCLAVCVYAWVCVCLCLAVRVYAWPCLSMPGCQCLLGCVRLCLAVCVYDWLCVSMLVCYATCYAMSSYHAVAGPTQLDVHPMQGPMAAPYSSIEYHPPPSSDSGGMILYQTRVPSLLHGKCG